MKRLLLVVSLTLAGVAPAFAQATPFETLALYRQQYPVLMSDAQLGELLNRVAYKYREDGMRLLGKAGGRNCPAPNGTRISCDFLVHLPTKTGHDVLTDNGTPTTDPTQTGILVGFTWGPGPEPLAEAIASGQRTIVEPTLPTNDNGPIVDVPPPVGIPPPVVQVNAVLPVALDIQRLANAIYAFEVAHESAEKQRADALAAQLKAHDEAPSWLGSLIKSPYFQVVLTAIGTVLTTRQVMK